jgi:hypothetical protein
VLDRAIGYAEALGAHCLVLSTGDIPHEPLGRKVAIFTGVFARFVTLPFGEHL